VFLIATFLETLLLIVFIYYAYDITGALVSMSQYLDSYEDRKGSLKLRLHSFRDVVAKKLLEQSPQLISGANGDLHKVYSRMVEEFVHLSHPHSPRSRQHPPASPEEPFLDKEEGLVDAGLKPERASIGLLSSLWPASLLLRRDIRGREPKMFRWVWVVYALFAICWMLQIQVVLAAQAFKEIERVLYKEYESLIPVAIIVLHTGANCMTIYVFLESLAPLGFTKTS